MKMVKKFLFCFPLKSGAWVMSLTNLVFAIVFIAVSINNKMSNQSSEDNLYSILGIIMGIFNLFTGVILLMAIVKGKEKLVLLYLLFELSNLMILTIFAAFNTFKYESVVLAGMFLVCIALWFGLYSMIAYYTEMAEYNCVKSGAIEITCNPHINPLMGLPEKAIESTAV